MSQFLIVIYPYPTFAEYINNDISVKFTDRFQNFQETWTGDVVNYEVDLSSIESHLNQIGGSANGTSTICRPSDVAFGRWEFSVEFEGFQTSNQNHALIWLQRTSMDASHGIFIKIGENGSSKRLRLIASDSNGSTTELLTSSQPFPTDLTSVQIRITRTPSSNWTLQYQYNTSGTWHSDSGSHSVDLHPRSLFCIATRFTPTRANKFRFGPIITSTYPTFLSHYEIPSPDQLHLHFSKLLTQDATSRVSIQIDDYPGSISVSRSDNILELRLNPAPSGGIRSLLISNLTDYETSLTPFTISTPIEWFDTAHPLDLVISEFTPRPSSPLDAFIELINTSSRYLDVNNWVIGRSSVSRTISHSRAIAPGDIIVIQSNPPPDPESGATHFIEASIFPLGMTTDRLYLRDNDGQLIDSVVYTPPTSSKWTIGQSIEKKTTTYAGMDPSNWTPHPISDSRGYPNQSEPIQFHSSTPSIEILIQEDSITTRFDRFIQWRNSESSAFLGLNELILPVWDPFSAKTLNLPTPTDIELQNSQVHLSYEDFFSYDGSQSFSLRYEAAQPPQPGDLLLNEILYQPLQNRYADYPDQSQFIEIKSTVPWKISLKDVMIRDVIDKHGAFSIISPEEPELWTIEGNGYALLVPDTSSIENSRLAQFFGLAPNRSWGHVKRAGLSLTTGGKPLILALKDGTTLDSVSYSPTMHNPLLRDQKGISLERVGGRTASEMVHWTSSADPLGATPGFLNSVSLSSPEHQPREEIQLMPNPFSPDHDGFDDVVEIKLISGSIDRFTRITIYDVTGRRIKTILNDALTGHLTSAIWDGTDDRGILCPTGIYLVLAESYNPESKKTQKRKKPLVLVRTR